MSRTKFLDAAEKHSDWRRKNNLPKIHYEKLFEEVRDKWIQEKRYNELIAFIIDEWDSGNCDDFINPLEKELVGTKSNRNFIHLWKGVIRRRLDSLWAHYDVLLKNEANINLQKILSININGFGFRTENFYSDRKKVVAFYRQFTLDGLKKFKLGLVELNELEEVNKVEKLIESVVNLQKPKPGPSTDKRKIDEPLFWVLISDSRHNAADKYSFLEKLKTTLETFRPKELRSFQKILLTKQNELNAWNIWALAYIVRRGCGDDGFDYFKSWIISKGQDVFNKVLLSDHNGLSGIFDEDPQLEELIYMAEEIYENRTGDIMKPVAVKKQKIKGTRWTEENLESAFPELCKLFSYQIEK